MKEENYPYLENIADLLWLSKFTGMQSFVREEVEDEKSQEPNQKPEIEDDEVEEDEPNVESEMEEEQEDDLEVHTDNQEDNTSSSKQKSAKAIQSPKKLALDHYREWEKAFKFINLKTASKNRYELDEEKTVENIASTKVFDLVFKRVEEKSFFLTLVIDQGETMELWTELIKNFEQMLMTMGVFSRITIYYWDTKKEKPILYVDKALKREVSEKLVVIDGQRNLVWVMSDCIAPAWKSGETFKSIERWTTKSFTSILQMFPKEMWMGTMLFKGKHIRLSSNNFNPINKKLKVKPAKREKDALKIPVISFDPYALQAWAKVVVNSKDNSISGIELENLDFEALKIPLKKEITSEMRMQRFYSQASPTAQKLAFYMSVLPVDFQVTRILQEERLSKSNQAHVAEVFLGGLIERRKKSKDIHYDFYPKVREELNANISADESFEIMSDMSDFVSSHLGIGFDFKALLADPNGAFEGDFSLHDESLAYAKLASRVLKRKGGELYTIAKKIDTKVNEIELESFPKNYEEQVIDKLSNTFIEELVNYEIDDESLTHDGGIATISQVGEPIDIELTKINKIQNNIYSIDVEFYIESYIEVENPSVEMFLNREIEYDIYVNCKLLVKFNENQELFSLNIEKITNVEISEQSYTGSPFCKIRVISVGGGGGNTVNHMIREGVEGIDLIVANTDKQALEASLASHKIQLGINTCHGLGSGMKPEIGKESAEESYESIKAMLDGADLVFIVTGLGGGTGTGASPIIARIAKEIGALTISVVSLPFNFEGTKRKKLANKGFEELKKESDSIISVSNERVLSIVEKNLGMRDSFRIVDNIFAQAIGSISNVILSHGANDINLDFDDIKIVMSHKGLALMGVGESQGDSASYNATKTAIKSPLLGTALLEGAMGIFVHFHIHPDYPLAEISEGMDIVEENADEYANIIFGTTTSEDIPLDEVEVTVIATGFEDPLDFNESDTIHKLVLRQLEQNSWDKSNIIQDYKIPNSRYRADLLLNYKNRDLAVIEIKSPRNEPKAGLKQAITYGKQLDIDYVYSTNGLEIYEYSLKNEIGKYIDEYPSLNELYDRYDSIDKQSKEDRLRNIPYLKNNLREHQKEAIITIIEGIINSNKRILLSLSLVAEKHIILQEVFHKLYVLNWYENKKPKILFLSDKNHVLRYMEKIFKKLEVNSINLINYQQTKKKDFDVLLSNYQIMEKIYYNYEKNFFDFIIIDEVPRPRDRVDRTKRWQRILGYYGQSSFISFTTLYDEKMRDYFGEIRYIYSYKDSVRDGLSLPYELIKFNMNLINEKQTEKILDEIDNNTRRNEKILIVCKNQLYVEMMGETFRRRQFYENYYVVISSEDKRFNLKNLQKFRNNKETHIGIITQDLLNIGVGNLTNIVLATPVQSKYLLNYLIDDCSSKVKRWDKVEENKYLKLIDFFYDANKDYYDVEFDKSLQEISREKDLEFFRRKQAEKAEAERLRVEKIELEKQREKEEQQASKEWATISNTLNLNVLKSFIDKYPQTSYAQKAKERFIERETYLNSLSLVERKLEELSIKDKQKSKSILLLSSIKKGLFDTEKCEALEFLKQIMRNNKEWKEVSKAKNTQKDKWYHRTLEVMELLKKCNEKFIDNFENKGNNMGVYQNFFENMDAEEWEFFSIDFLNFLGYKILQSPSRGADGGLDGLVEYNNIKYLVSCKHFIQSKKSVGTSIENNITDRMYEHDAKGFIGFYSTLPSSSLISRFKAIEKRGFKIKYYDRDIISDYLPNIPSNILQKYGLPNNIKYVMNIHPSEYQPLKCMICDNIDILEDDRINISRVQISINENSELEFFYGCKECLPWEEVGWLEINEALHQDRFIDWNNYIEEKLLKYKPSPTFFQNKNKFDNRIQQRMFPSNWGQHPLSLIR